MPDLDFRIFADEAPVMIWRSGADGLCDYFNKLWLDFRGRELAQEIGEGWADGVHPEDLDRCLGTYRASFERRESFTMEYRLRRHDGEFRWVEDHGKPFWRNGEFAGYFGSCIDVTKHHATEQKLLSALSERELLLREVHHRVKNNFQTLMALTRFMRRDAEPAARQALGLLETRLSVMAMVQKFLHDSDDLTTLSVGNMVQTMLPELAAMDGGPRVGAQVGEADFVLPAKTCSYLGLAICESAILLGSRGARQVTIFFQPEAEGMTVVIRGRDLRVAALENHPGLRLAQQYARGADAGLAVTDQEGEAAILLVPRRAMS